VPQINRDGVAIHYEVKGEGPALLFTHGYCASGRMWAPQLEALSVGQKMLLRLSPEDRALVMQRLREGRAAITGTVD